MGAITKTGHSQGDLQTYYEATVGLVNQLRTLQLTRCVTPPTFVIDTNFDIKNSVDFEIIVDGVLTTVAADVNFDTGTTTPIATSAYWACALLSIDTDGTTAYVDWGTEAATEAAAKALLSAVTATGDVVCGYVAVHAKAGQDLVAGTDALTGGTGGQVAQTTTYYNNQYVGATALGTLTLTAALDLSP